MKSAEEKAKRRKQIAEENKALERQMKSRLRNSLLELKRKEKKSDEDIAYEIGISRQNLSKYMNGEALPSSLNMRRIADYLEIPYDYLTAKEDGTSPAESEIIKHIGLTRKSIKTLLEYKNDINKRNVLFGINQLIEQDSPDFFEVLSRYIRIPKVNQNDFTNDWFYFLYVKYYLAKVDSTSLSDEFRNSYEAITVDDVIYHQVVREFNRIMEKAKNSEETKARYIRQIEESLKVVYDDAILNYESPKEIAFLDIEFP